MFVAVLVGACALGLACSTPAKVKQKRFIPASENDSDPNPTSKDTHFDEVKKAAAAQLQCPIDQINIVCLHRDSDGECVQVRADGCDKTYEYQFGEPGG
jgi:hypothetical protein